MDAPDVFERRIWADEVSRLTLPSQTCPIRSAHATLQMNGFRVFPNNRPPLVPDRYLPTSAGGDRGENTGSSICVFGIVIIDM